MSDIVEQQYLDPGASSNSSNLYFDAEDGELTVDSCLERLDGSLNGGKDEEAQTSGSVCSTTIDEVVVDRSSNKSTTLLSSRPLATIERRDSTDAIMSQDPTWKGQTKHIFILSEAGKPIYSLHGNEDKLAILFGIIQALISFVENSQDVITSIRAKGIQFVFMVKSNLIFVAASRTSMSVTQLQMQLK